MEPVEATEALLADMPLPSDTKTFFLGGIFVLASLSAAYVASDIVLPLIFAIMLNLLMQPALRALERLRVPRALGSIVLIVVVFATIVGIGAAVSGPAEAWIAKLPEGIPRIVERLRFLDAPINTLQTFLTAANNFGAAGPQQSSPGPLDGGAILSSVFAGTRSFAGGLFTTVMFLYFLLLAGDSFLRRLVEVLPRFASKRQAVEISQQIGRDISAYLLTITIMNALVGVATAPGHVRRPEWAIPFSGARSPSFSTMSRFSGPPRLSSFFCSPARSRSPRPGRLCSRRRSMSAST